MEKKWAILNWIIIINFILQILNGAYQVFVVWQPEGVFGPALDSSKDIPFEFMVTRRLYAIEFWIACVGLAIYLAIVYRDKLKA